MNEEFKELKSPEEGADGWYVAAKYEAGWLDINGEISRDTSDVGLKLLYHKTEGDAYRVMASYYDLHGQYQSGKIIAGIADITDDVESQEMHFNE